MTGRASFRQADVTRAARGLKVAGVTNATIRLRAGEVIIHIGEAANEAGEPNEWDEVFDEAQAPPSA